MTTREEIHAYLDTLPPHVRVRKAAQLLVAAAKEFDALEAELRLMAKDKDDITKELSRHVARLIIEAT